MGNDNTVESVGLGVDLLDGESTLTQLRAIRTEMQAIAELAGRSPRTPQTAQIASQQRNVAASVAATKDASNQELDILARAEVRKTTQRTEVKRRADQLIADEQQTTQRLVAERQNRVRQLSQSDDILFRDLGSERSSFKRYRNDPARDQQTNIYRRQLSEEVQAQRLAQRSEKSELDRLSQERVAAEAERARLRQAELDKIAENERARTVERQRLLLRESSVAIHDPNRPLTRPIRGGTGGPETGPGGQPLRTVAGERGYFTTNSKGKIQFNPLGGGGGGAVPPAGGGEGGEDEGGGGKGGSSIFGTAGRLTRNFLIYRALTGITFGLARYTEESLAAAKATSEQANALLFATEAAKGNLQANRALADQLATVGYNRAESQQVVAAAARATFRHPEQTAALANVATNIAALRGGGLDQTPKVIEDIIGGRDRAYREYFNITPEEIYKEAAKKRLAQNTNTFGLTTVGKQDYETEAQKVSKYVAALTEEEKEQLRLNYVLSQSFRFEGDAAERAGTLAGKMDLLSSAFFNAKANIGAFIADTRPLKGILDSLAGAGPSGSLFRPPQLAQSGPQNTITDADVVNFGTDNSVGLRPQLVRLVNKLADSISPAALHQKLLDYGSPYEGPRVSEAQYDEFVGENIARDKQARQRREQRGQGQLGYRSITPNLEAPNEYFSYEQLANKGYSSGSILKNFIEELKPTLVDGAKDLAEYRAKYKLLQDTIDDDTASGNVKGAKFAQEQQYLLEAQSDAKLIDSFAPPGYREEAQKRNDEFLAKQKQDAQKERDEKVAEYTHALGKLREAQQGAFRLPGDIGATIAGSDNPYVKVFADQITAAERMKQQWGFLGKAATDYFTTIERASVARELNKIEYQTYEASSNLKNKADKEALDRTDTRTLSRRDQDYLDIQSAIVDKALQIPKLWQQAAEVLGIRTNPLQQLQGRIASLQVASGLGAAPQGKFGVIPGFGSGAKTSTFIAPDGTRTVVALDSGQRNDYALYAAQAKEVAGLSPQARSRLQEQYADAALSILNEFSPQQIRQAGLQNVYAGAINVKAQGLDQRIADAQEKARFGAIEDSRLSNQLRLDEAFRRRRLSEGGDASDVGRSSDSLLIARTEGISPKDLTLDQFHDRNEALRRQAERGEQDRQEAKAAVEEGLKQRALMLNELQVIRAAILGGDLSMLIQVQNDTQARIDQANLKELSSGKYNVPLDQGQTKSNPYSDSFDRYSRGGRKR